MANISSAATGDWNATSSWSGGAVPVAGDKVTILNTHDITLTQDQPAGAVIINSGGTLTGGGFKLTLNDAAGTTFIFSNVGTISGVLDIDITGGSADRPINEAGTGNIRNLVINNAQTYRTHYHLTLDGNLTITTGVLTTNNGSSDMSLTVGTNTDDGGATGHLLILDDGELICNSSTVIVGSVYCQIAAGSNGTGFSELNLPDSSGSFTVRGPEKNGYVFRLDNQAECNHNGGTVTFAITAESGTTIMDVTSLRGTGVNNILVTQSESGTSSTSSLQFVGSDTVKGNLTLTGNGTNTCNVDTNFNGANFTVDGDVTVNNHSILGVRNTNTGTFTMGSLTIASGGTYGATTGTTTITKTSATPGHSGLPSAIEVKSGGTFTNNDGTVLLSSSLDQDLEFDGTGNMHHLTINKSDNDVIHNSNLTIEGNLSITLATAHTFRPNTGSRTLTVIGDVTIVEGKVGATTNYTGAISFGSLTIESGGTYIATSGTTTITDETSGGYGLINSGTYTHNKGKLKIDFNTPNKDAHTIIQVNDLYDLEIDMNASNYEVKFDDTSGNATNILNNLDITQGVFESKDNGDTLTIHGLTRITSNGTFMPDANHDTNKIIHNGLVTNSGTYKINDGTTVKMNGGIRNLGTITVA